ncbi:sugar phosphate isomerase/epimerase family protein [Maritalea sp.]|uniref:sugar phosphate isomerase/epimerase family protein n=1 Tax=Maritalea sp. TaxID=2003361 RepID=UPI003EF70EE5
MNLSFQLYSSRNFQPWDKMLEALADNGYTQVEGYGDVFDDPAAFSKKLESLGLKMPSGHFSIEMLENDFDAALSIAKTFGMSHLYCPYLDEPDRPKDAAGWQEFAHRLSAIADKLEGEGIGFGWHNHNFEFEALADGQFPMTIILENAPNISWEADVAWIVVGGQDPFAWTEKYGNRISAIHIKDIAPEGENVDQDGWCDVGAGTMDWAELLNTVKSKTNARIFVLEHDNPADGFAFAKNSIQNINKF